MHSKVQKLIISVALAVCCVWSLNVSAYAASAEKIKAKIGIDGSTQTASQKIAVQVSVSVNDPEVREDKLALSYHISTPDGTMLLFEGTRIPLEQWADGKITNIPVSIDLSIISNVSQEEKADIVFDIVNESEGYWFESSPGVDLDSAVVEYRGGFEMKFKESLQKALRRPVTLVVNGACVAIFIVFLIKKKSWTV